MCNKCVKLVSKKCYKGVTNVKQVCKKCEARESACQLLKIIKKMVVNEDNELIHKKCNCYTTVVSHIYTYDRAQNILIFVQPLQKLIL